MRMPAYTSEGHGGKENCSTRFNHGQEVRDLGIGLGMGIGIRIS